MSKSIKTVLLILFCSATVLAQRTEKRDLETFDEISFTTNGTIYLRQGNTQKVELKGDREDLDEIRTEVRSGRLFIGKKSDNWLSWNSNSRIEFYITVKNLNAITISGSGKVYGESKFNTDYLEISIPGSGKLELEANAKSLDVSVSGSGKLLLKGEGSSSEISISGSGKVDAEDFIAESHRIRISGSGSCYIHADKSIDARISGSGSVRYKGDPSKVNSRSSGSGKVRRI